MQRCFAAQVDTATLQAETGDFVKVSPTCLHCTSHVACVHGPRLLFLQVYYTGKLDDGSVFDSNVEQEPLQFEIGAGKVIPGFDDAVTGLAEGEKRTQHIPAAKAYGECTCQKPLQRLLAYHRSSDQLVCTCTHLICMH